jgi:hypothetical protein
VTKHSKNFISSGLDEVFADLAKRKQEAIDKGWIIQEVLPESKQPKPEPETEKTGGSK